MEHVIKMKTVNTTLLLYNNIFAKLVALSLFVWFSLSLFPLCWCYFCVCMFFGCQMRQNKLDINGGHCDALQHCNFPDVATVVLGFNYEVHNAIAHQILTHASIAQLSYWRFDNFSRPFFFNENAKNEDLLRWGAELQFEMNKMSTTDYQR